MRRGLNSQAYTIVEVIIVLAVSSALLVSALLLVGGQQNKTQFYQSVRDTEQQVQDIINNVATGYYSRSTNFSCYESGGLPTINTLGSNPLGSNKDCMFIGRVIQFNVGGVPENFAVYNIVGLREDTAGGAITDLAQAQPTVLTGTTENRTLKYGLSATKMYYNDDPANNIGVVGFFSTLGQPGVAGLESGSQHVELHPLSTPTLGGGAISGTITAVIVNNVDSVKVCFDSGSTDQHADLIIGGNGRQTSTQLNIGSGQC